MLNEKIIAKLLFGNDFLKEIETKEGLAEKEKQTEQTSNEMSMN